MHSHAVTDDLVRTLIEERIARSLHAHRAAGLRAQRNCPLERLGRWLVARRQTKLDPALLAR